ncbi:fumarylacetoacetate hydrolase family protein [Pontivivens ytuae]|uniref:Fumarylacetoacetate hydrolase family protein n=1 Tax=Pontivivens ytuae TaxID=2789856 RepID=A0A7S9LNN8_9RHOB|nr:fumarylacetoacetate hydrolase family protein [Pontivivens ytuae]QPH52457.1 fumarylacetoacetate hydrolase family protein [Pontivivens ytuae]
MKLMNVGAPGAERAAVLDSAGRVRDLSGIVERVDAAFLAGGLDAVRGVDVESLPLVEGERVGPCVLGVPTFWCIGLNYAAHAAESGATPPAEPIVFSKAASALAGPEDELVLPASAQKADWEVELGVVIGRRTWQVNEAEALDHVAGYCTINDISERAWQIEGTGQWIKGKSGPGFGPIGPWLVVDEVADPQELDLTLRLNGEVRQSSNTSDMIFTVAEIIAHLSRHAVLLPGDVIATGTPEGVGMGASPQRFLRDGDVMELEVAGLGRQRQVVRVD